MIRLIILCVLSFMLFFPVANARFYYYDDGYRYNRFGWLRQQQAAQDMRRRQAEMAESMYGKKDSDKNKFQKTVDDALDGDVDNTGAGNTLLKPEEKEKLDAEETKQDDIKDAKPSNEKPEKPSEDVQTKPAPQTESRRSGIDFKELQNKMNQDFKRQTDNMNRKFEEAANRANNRPAMSGSAVMESPRQNKPQEQPRNQPMEQPNSSVRKPSDKEPAKIIVEREEDSASSVDSEVATRSERHQENKEKKQDIRSFFTPQLFLVIALLFVIMAALFAYSR